MANDRDHTRAPMAGMLDLDEPEPEPSARSANPLDDTAPPWNGHDQLFIDVEGNIHVRGGRFFHSRAVGKVRGEEGEAIVGALFDRFQELEDRFKVLQREIKGSRNLVRSLKSANSFVHWVEGAKAIGDFEGLLGRAHALADGLELTIEGSRSRKTELVERAEKLAESTSWKATGETMNELMEQWKHAGSAGGDEDDALWERFRTARSTFFTRRSQNFAESKKVWSEHRKAKESLISNAAELAGSTDWEATFEAMQVLMEEWKQVGSAGRKHDDELWERFRAARDPFFEARKAHFAEQRKQERQRSHDRGAPRRGRRDGGPRPPRRDAPPRGQSRGGGGPGRTRSTGTLHASLAEILGPMKDLFPGADAKDSKKGTKDKG